MKKWKTLVSIGCGLIVTACGGGGGNSTPTATSPAAPLQIADFSVGKFTATGDTVLKPNFSNIGGAYCVFSGTLTGIQTALSPLSGLDLLNCPRQLTGLTFMEGGSGTSPEYIATSPPRLSTNSPIKVTGTATAGQTFSFENSGIGSILSALSVGQARATSNSYFWMNFPSSSTGTTTLNFSYVTTAGSAPSALQTFVQHKIDVAVTMYWYDQFNQAQGQTFPILTQTFENDFTKSITFSINPADYPFPHTFAGLALRTSINSATIVGRKS